MRPSKTFANSRDVYKMVDDEDMVAFVVVRGVKGGAMVRPLYRADAYAKTKTRGGKPVTNVFSSYEHGSLLHGTYQDDPDGQTFALIAAHAIEALVVRAWARSHAARVKPKQAKRERPRTKKKVTK